ncbi:MAG: sulfatase-like hydrolase/transferase [Pirellulales bacterium]|nr:sulfatase-like hydrolase/transferase [Pirellulales bacterium]
MPQAAIFGVIGLVVFPQVVLGQQGGADAGSRPNILWITSEDNSPYLGCYGDALAHTPHLDRLAAEGVRYRNAFANAPVCSTARTTLITGMYACSLGAENHRSRVRIPDGFLLYPASLRAAGYYSTNNSKTDYNLANPGKAWDESSPRAHYWEPKPFEELYDAASDPYEIRDLAADPQYGLRLAEMRRTLREELISIRDAGFIPEGMRDRLAGEKTIYEYTHSDAYPLERIIDLAEMATSRNPAALGQLTGALEDPHPVIRYWAATGCLILQDKAAPAKDRLKALLDDPWGDVRIVAAEALGYLGQSDAALATLDTTIRERRPYEVLAGLNTLEYLWKAGHTPLAPAQAMVKDLQLSEPADRISRYLLGFR